MQLIRGLSQVESWHRQAAISIGKFDALHLGHQQLFKRIREYARRHQLPSMVVLFEPYPEDFFSHQIKPRLSSLKDKLLFLKQSQIDLVLCLAFNARLANLSAERFIEDILIERLAINKLWLGHDFRFGKNRQGDFALLQHYAKQRQFALAEIEAYRIDAQKVSSSAVRQLVAQADFSKAQLFMGHAFSINARVIKGQQLGRKLGFATANINLASPTVKAQAKLLPTGVYAIRAYLNNRNQAIQGVANLGFKPTLVNQDLSLEVHLFDFAESIYGQHLRCEFVRQIRNEKQFASLDDLKKQISLDCQQAKQYLSSR